MTLFSDSYYFVTLNFNVKAWPCTVLNGIEMILKLIKFESQQSVLMSQILFFNYELFMYQNFVF